MAALSTIHFVLACWPFIVAHVCAHGIATALVQFPGGTFYRGYNPSYQYAQPPPTVIGWSTPQDLQNGFVSPSAYASPDIVCHLGATPAGAEAPVNAGDTLEIQWTPWPISHQGPVLDYLANCNGPCEKADKTKLKFFKISEAGLLDAARDSWAANVLTNNNNSWLVRLPEDIAPGNYVLRHEIIALHVASQPNGAQNYPFCFSLAVSSQGTKNPDGIPATQFYKANDPGVTFDLTRKYDSYKIPGASLPFPFPPPHQSAYVQGFNSVQPPLYSGALSISQTKPGPIKATSSGVQSLARRTDAAVPRAPAAEEARGAAATFVA